ncbi:shelterin complex subunit, TPP1/ACD [Nitzschia inconspicua]|uniref:Shelterin complex subunit, TPP1/ACD n=1 Tax=Nitzschia inconspicua TaxID=303405 RepID=A0A9K3LI12_9STRA|nr:shelterin complex subunit, TPP1/ACD [Nitzschia inconspicua]KAG7362408.1 shelterin complex subunit, TPP1/ACD [Nitzschia inconspicua]
MAPWLVEYILEKLTPNPNKNNNNNSNNTSVVTNAAPIPRLVQIMSRGGDWWTNPVESNRKSAWVILSDGHHNIKSIMTPAALKHILEEQPVLPRTKVSSTSTSTSTTTASFYPFYNYSRGSCALIRDYSAKIHNQNNNNGTTTTTTTSIVLEIGSIEAKPGFHLPTDGMGNRSNSTNNNHHHHHRIQQSIEDDINVRYALQAWNERTEAEQEPIPQQQQQQQQQQQHIRRQQQQRVDRISMEGGQGGNRGTSNTYIRPTKRQRTVPLGNVMTTVMNNPHAYEAILQLAEVMDREEAQQQEDDDHGGGNFDESQDTNTTTPTAATGRTPSKGRGNNNINDSSPPLMETQPQYPNESNYNQRQRQHQQHGWNNPSTPESQSQSRMYIQNVLFSPEEEQDWVDTTGPQTTSLATRRSNMDDTKKTTWDLVKEQLCNPAVAAKNKMIYFHHDDANNKAHGERTMNRVSATPAVTSAAYFRRYGLARWMQHNVKRRTLTPQT